MWCDVWCESTDNNIGDEGANALIQCLARLTFLTHLDLSCECVHWCVTWCVTWCVWCDITLMWCVWVQGTALNIREQLHLVRACQTWHNSHTLTWVVSVCIDVSDVMCNVTLMCDLTYDVCEYRQPKWRWGSYCTESVLVTIDTTHIPWLEWWVCYLVCVICVMPHWCVMWCDEYREQY